MLEAFLNRLLELKRPEIVDCDGRPYSIETLHPMKDPVPAPLTVSTLTGLADYLTENPDQLPLTDLIVEVKSHTEVLLLSTVKGVFEQRANYLNTSITLEQFPFGQYMDLEMFIISLQSKFVQDETTAALLKLAGNITGENVQNYSDDGVTQKVLARVGIVAIGDAQVPNPVTLAPFRTFLEVAQPASKFVYRLKQGEQGIRCALIEADGGNWKLESISRIRDWLRVHLPPGMIILA